MSQKGEPRATLSLSLRSLFDLPTDILVTLPDYLHSLDDLFALIRICRVLYNTCAASTAVLPHISVESFEQCRLPQEPHLLLTATARQIADWAVQSDERRDQLLEAIKEGPEGLLKLAIKVSRLGSNEVQKLHKAKVEVLEPLSRLIRGEIGVVAAKQEEDFLHDLDDDQGIGPACKDIEPALLYYLIYCELVDHDIDKACNSTAVDVEPLSTDFRRKYCVQDAEPRYDSQLGTDSSRLDV
ncbi:MAG: hypothetical protein M1830_001599, partial [Pleopsidium flavum]